jgi:hypothetical protein
MQYFANVCDRFLRSTAQQWETTALAALRALEGRREDRVSCFDAIGEPDDGKWEGADFFFEMHTTALVREAHDLGLDPGPIQAFYQELLNSWNLTPPHLELRHLREMFEAALVVLFAIDEEVRRRMVGGQPESGDVSTGPDISTNGSLPQVVIPGFFPTRRQKAILDALYRRALRTDDLVRYSKIDKTGVMRAKKELEALGLIRWIRHLGFYRTDAPPPELEGHQRAT